MARPKKIKEVVRVSFVISKEQSERVSEMARRMSVLEKRNITFSEAVRMAVENVYPVPKGQMDLFI